MAFTQYPVGSDQAARINLDDFAAREGREDARVLEGDFDVPTHANELVDQLLEQNDNLTDDEDEFRARFVDAYTQAFQEQRNG